MSGSGENGGDGKNRQRQEVNEDSQFQAVRDIHLSEQGLYWQRFIAFSALHAGLLVVLSEQSVGNPVIVKAFGIALGVMWAYAQCASLYYARMYKDQFDELCTKFGIRSKSCKPPFRSTSVGVVVAFLVLLLWIVALCVRV